VSEQRPAMQNAASVARPDPRLNAQIDAILAARHSDPFSLLGPHLLDGNWTMRFFLPGATEASVSLRSTAVEGAAASVPVKVTNAVKLRPEGFFEATWLRANPSRPPRAVTRSRDARTSAIPSKSSILILFRSSSASLICTSWARAATTTLTKSSAPM